jgi:DNA polymerase-1
VTPISIDTETALIRPALLAPPMTCLTHAQSVDNPKILHALDGAHEWLGQQLSDPSVLLVAQNAEFDAAVICAEFPDLVPFIFAAYRANRVTCTKKRQQLLDIAGGVYRGRPGHDGRWIVHKYDLDALSRKHLGKPLIKDGWRLRYGEFRDVPLNRWVEHARVVQVQCADRLRELEVRGLLPFSETTLEKAGWPAHEIEELEREVKGCQAIVADVPEGVIRYPLEDASTCLGVYLSQEKHAAYLKDQYRQAYAYFVLYLSSAWGMRTSPEGVASLKAQLEDAYEEIQGELMELGFVRANGTRDMKLVKASMVAACREFGLPLRRTEGHAKKGQPPCPAGDVCEEHVSLDSDACEAVMQAAGQFGGETPFVDYAEFVALGKMLNNDCRMLAAGTVYPVHTHYDLAETGRTTSSKPNIQNLNTGRVKNKSSKAQNLRHCVRQAFVPRPGKVFFQADYPQLELYTLAQCCMSWLGFSELAALLNAGHDPHLAMAAKICGITYEEAVANKKREDVDHARQIGKVFNFGKPGGLGNKKLIVWARKTYGVLMTEAECEGYTAQWYEAFPEMRPYFARVNSMFAEGQERCSVETLWTERRRGAATYCAACNNGFQALGVDCAKLGLCLIAESQYTQPSSALFGTRTVAFVHDEVIGECDDDSSAHDVAHECAKLMCQGANQLLPDVPIKLSKMEPTLMRVWSKDAKQVWDANRRLVPWAP